MARDRPAELADFPIRFRAYVTAGMEPDLRIQARDPAAEDSERFRLDVAPDSSAAYRAERLAAAGSGETLCIVHAVVRLAANGTTSLELLRLTPPTDPLTPEEAGALRLAEDFLARSNPQAARRRLRELLEAREHAPQARRRMLLALAHACIGCLDQEGATDALERLVALDAGHAEAAALLAGLAERPLKDPDAQPGRAATEVPLPGGPDLEPPGGRGERETLDEPDPEDPEADVAR